MSKMLRIFVAVGQNMPEIIEQFPYRSGDKFSRADHAQRFFDISLCIEQITMAQAKFLAQYKVAFDIIDTTPTEGKPS